jgi:hypothetical protein
MMALLAASVTACAAVHVEQRHEVVVDESVRVQERPRPELWVTRVDAKVEGDDILFGVRREERCLVDFAERRVERDTLRRHPDTAVIVAETVVLAAGVGSTIFVAQLSNGSDEPGSNDSSAVALEATGAVAAVVAGTALLIDASKAEERTTETVTLSRVQEQRVVRCARQGPPPARVELRTTTGHRFLAGLDHSGRGRMRLPSIAWSFARIDGDLYVDGRLVRRLVLRRPP